MKNLSLFFLAVFLFATVNCFAEIQLTAAQIPFSFIAEGKTYPAGTYRFSMDDSENIVTIYGEKGAKAAGVVPIATRLAARLPNETELVFDVVGSDHLLSELYVPDREGFYFKSATGKHTHVKVKGIKK